MWRSPLGIFAPGFKRIDDRFTAMVNELEGIPTGFYWCPYYLLTHLYR